MRLDRVDASVDSFFFVDKVDAPLGDAPRRESEAALAGSRKSCLAHLEQANNRGVQEEPRIAALHPADHARVGLLVSDIIGPGRKAD
jgi:hypothetical protein